MSRFGLGIKLPLRFWIGGTLLIISNIGIFLKREPFVTCFYPLVWWSYIIAIDGLVFYLNGSSLFSRLKSRSWLLIIVSFLFWEFFEFLNKRMVNWSYFAPSFPFIIRKVFRFLSFSTVLPIILETYEFFHFLIKREIKGRALNLEDKPDLLWMSLGCALFLFSIIWPEYFFWGIWLALIFILDPWTKKISGESLSVQLSKGNFKTLILLVATGIITGFLWEGWNYWAGIKWRYNIPFVGNWRIFEMPVLGYFGFVGFSIESYVFYKWFSALTGFERPV
jgi:hypothetical protein